MIRTFPTKPSLKSFVNFNKLRFSSKTWKIFKSPVLPFLVFFGILCFFPVRGIPCFFFERFSFLFQGFQGFSGDKKSLFFWWFSLPFFQKNQGKEGQGGGQRRKINPKSLGPVFSLYRHAGIDAALVGAQFYICRCTHHGKITLNKTIRSTKVESAEVAFDTVRLWQSLRTVSSRFGVEISAAVRQSGTAFGLESTGQKH